MNNLESAIQFLRETKAPYWELQVRYDGGSAFSKLFIYEPSQDPEIDKLEESIAQLSRKLTSMAHHPTASFQIYAKTSSTANKDTRFGPYPFSLAPQNPGYQANPYGISFGGLGSNPGMPQAPMFADLIQQIQGIGQQREQVLIEQMNTKISSAMKEMELKQKEAQLAEKERELKERESEVNKRHDDYRQTIVEGTLKAGKIMLDTWAPPGSGKKAAAEILSGLEKRNIIPASEQPAEQRQEQTAPDDLTPEEKLLNAIAGNIADHVQDEEGIKVVGVLVNEIIKTPGLIDKYKTQFKNAQKNEQASIPDASQGNDSQPGNER